MRYFWLFIITILSLVFFGTSFANRKPNDWLRSAYERSHHPGEGEPYSVDAEAGDMFDTQLDLVETAKWLIKSGEIKDAIWEINAAINNAEWIQNIIDSLDKEIAHLLLKKSKGKRLTDLEKLKLADLQSQINQYKKQLKGALSNLKSEVSKEIKSADSIFVRMTKFLLRFSVILMIPIFVFIGIKFVLAFWDEWKMKEALKQIWYVSVGVLLALFSVMIIYLVSSMTRSGVSVFMWW